VHVRVGVEVHVVQVAPVNPPKVISIAEQVWQVRPVGKPILHVAVKQTFSLQVAQAPFAMVYLLEHVLHDPPL